MQHLFKLLFLKGWSLMPPKMTQGSQEICTGLTEDTGSEGGRRLAGLTAGQQARDPEHHRQHRALVFGLYTQ